MTATCRLSKLGRSLVLVAAAIVGLPTPGHPEDQTTSPGSLGVGARVRITAPAVLNDRVTGIVGGMDAKSLLVVAGDRRLTVPRETILQLEVSQGKRRRTLKGMMFGAGIGALLFPRALYGYCLSECGSQWDAGYILAGAGLGAVCGAGIGALLKTDRWAVVPARGLKVSLRPSRRGVSGVLSVTF